MSTVVITSKTPCACCGSSCLTTRFKGFGEACIPGAFPQFDDTLPPQNYKTWSQSGSMDLGCGGFSCGNPCATNVVISGSCGLGGGSAQAAISRGGGPPEIIPGCFGPFVDRPCSVTETKTQSSWSASGSGCCFDDGQWWEQHGTQTVTLSNPGTTEEAIASVDAGIWSSWGAWGIAAIYNTAPRATSYCFPYRPVQWRVNQGGFSTGNYKVNVAFWRRPATGGTYALYRTDVITATVGPDGIFNAEGDVPNDDGYETEPRCDCVIVRA